MRFTPPKGQDARHYDPVEGRFICNEDHPWPGPEAGRVRHVDAEEVGDQYDGYPGGDLVDMKCPHCGAVWTKELAQ